MEFVTNVKCDLLIDFQ